MLKAKRLSNFEEIKRSISSSSRQPLFQSSWYLETFAKHFTKNEGVILLGLFQADKFIGYGAFEKVESKTLLLGMKKVMDKEEVTDYGDIFLSEQSELITKEAWAVIINWFKGNGTKGIQLDYVREDSLTYKTFQGGKTKQEISPYISLPSSWDEYLELLDRKDRKELKRKMNRLDAVRNFHVCSEETVNEDFEEFVRLHRLSDSQKRKFMSEEMKQFFWDLVKVEKSPWDANICSLRINDKITASLLTFDFEDKIYAYNSGYDPAYDFYSVGLLLHAFKIKDAIKKGKKLYDFLRGGERYKYDLGAKDLELYKIVISLR